jgi:hypothetical protein
VAETEAKEIRVLDYAPTFPATAEVARGLKVYIDRMPKDFPYGEDDSPEHLRWMVDQIVSNAATQAHPVDKLSRWLGYIQGILRAHRVLDTVAERDRTRPIFHAAYIEMGIKPPEKKDRASPAEPVLADFVRKWSFPFRHRVASAFVRGLTGLASSAAGDRVSVASIYHHDIFGPNGGALGRMALQSPAEAERRFAFFEQFLDEIRLREQSALVHASIAHTVGTLFLYGGTGMMGAVAVASLAKADLATAGAAVMVSTISYLGALALRKMVNGRLANGAAKLASFRANLPWIEDKLDGVQIIDDLMQSTAT